MTKIRCGSVGCKYNGDEFCEKEEINVTDIIKSGKHLHRCEDYEDSQEFLEMREMLKKLIL